jgi:hypothetical protein
MAAKGCFQPLALNLKMSAKSGGALTLLAQDNIVQPAGTEEFVQDDAVHIETLTRLSQLPVQRWRFPCSLPCVTVIQIKVGTHPGQAGALPPTPYKQDP